MRTFRSITIPTLASILTLPLVPALVLAVCLATPAHARLDEDTAQLLRRPDSAPTIADLDAEIYRVSPRPKRAVRPATEVTEPTVTADDSRTPATAEEHGG